MSGRRSPPAIWASSTRSRLGRLWTGQACVWSRGPTGCKFRCLYCHNPDTWTMTNGIPVTIAKAVEELRKYRHGLKVMSGGFTISGGEPLMQHRFVLKLFSAAKAMGIHTALDTNGYLGDRLTRRRPEDHRPGAAGYQDVGSGAPPPSHWHGHRPDAGFRAASGCPQTADLASFRPGAGADRRPGRHRAASPRSPAASAMSNESTCCRSTRWAAQVEAARHRVHFVTWNRRVRSSSSGVRGLPGRGVEEPIDDSSSSTRQGRLHSHFSILDDTDLALPADRWPSIRCLRRSLVLDVALRGYPCERGDFGSSLGAEPHKLDTAVLACDLAVRACGRVDDPAAFRRDLMPGRCVRVGWEPCPIARRPCTSAPSPTRRPGTATRVAEGVAAGRRRRGADRHPDVRLVDGILFRGRHSRVRAPRPEPKAVTSPILQPSINWLFAFIPVSLALEHRTRRSPSCSSRRRWRSCPSPGSSCSRPSSSPRAPATPSAACSTPPSATRRS